MRNLLTSSLILPTVFMLLSCKTTPLKPTYIPTETAACSIDPAVLTSGQVRYFKEMDMKISSCPGVQYFKGAPNSDAIGTIFSALGVDYEVDPYLYVDIEFYGKLLPSGEIEISHIEKAELTEKSIFDEFE